MTGDCVLVVALMAEKAYFWRVTTLDADDAVEDLHGYVDEIIGPRVELAPYASKGLREWWAAVEVNPCQH